MHCDMLKIQDGGAIVEKVNYSTNMSLYHIAFLTLPQN